MDEYADLDRAVDEFAAAMKRRLRQKAKRGFSGWRHLDRVALGPRLLVKAATGAVTGEKRALVDVANFAMMLHRHDG